MKSLYGKEGCPQWDVGEEEVEFEKIVQGMEKFSDLRNEL